MQADVFIVLVDGGIPIAILRARQSLVASCLGITQLTIFFYSDSVTRARLLSGRHVGMTLGEIVTPVAR